MCWTDGGRRRTDVFQRTFMDLLQIKNRDRFEFDSWPGASTRKLLSRISDCSSVLQTGRRAIAASEHLFYRFACWSGGRGSVVERSIMGCQLRTAFQPFRRPTTNRVIWANKNFFCCLLLSRTVQLTACPRPACSTVLRRLSIDHLDDERCVQRFRVAKLTKCMTDTGGQTDCVSYVSRQDTSEQLVAGSPQCRSSRIRRKHCKSQPLAWLTKRSITALHAYSLVDQSVQSTDYFSHTV